MKDNKSLPNAQKLQDLRKQEILWLLAAVLFNFLVYYGGRILSANQPHAMLATTIDTAIPFLPWTILIYWGCYEFWIVNYSVSVCFESAPQKGRFLIAHFIGESVCFFVYVLFPTTTLRPDVTGTGLLDFLVKVTYHIDEPDNLLPSIHCFVSWLCWIGVRGNPHITRGYQRASLIAAVAVCLSTLTVKQHVLADVIAGIVLAEVSYYLAGRLKILVCRATALHLSSFP